MTSVGRAAAVILILAAVAAAAPFAPGTRFGTIGVDYRFSSGDLYTYSYDSQYVKLDPLFRAGIAVLPNLTIGAELGLFNTFPVGHDLFTNTPVFAFCPTATLYPALGADVFLPYVAAGAGATYAFAWDRLGWRTRLAAGAALVTRLPVAFGLEGGWYHDWSQVRRWSSRGYELAWLQGNTGFVGVRVTAFKR
jgi:hypothetical protein